MKIFDRYYLETLINDAKFNTRLRQHINIHDGYQESCQRLFNALEPGSYIRPHNHSNDPKDELLIGIRGVMALVTFDDQGVLMNVLRFGTEKFGKKMAVGVEVPASTWHTVVALQSGSILLEVKEGPFNPSQPKNLATWAPEEGSAASLDYMDQLVKFVDKFSA